MAIEVRVPQMGESIVEAVIGAWRKREGEPVAVGDVLVELETEKSMLRSLLTRLEYSSAS